jgi:putative MATE family efflux protein
VFGLRRREDLDLTDGSVGWPLVHLAVPVVAAALLQTAYNLTDTFWVGRYGSPELAALTFSFPLVFLSLTLGGGVSTAGAVLVAQYEGATRAGREDRDEERDESEESRGDGAETPTGGRANVEFAAGQALSYATLGGVAVAAVAVPLLPHLLPALGADPQVAPLAVGYLSLVFAGLPFLFLAGAFTAALRGFGDVWTPLAVVAASVALNAVLDPLLIFGVGPVPELGLRGAALATVGARGLAAVAGVYLLLSGRLGLRARLADLAPTRRFLGRVVRIGLPSSLEGFSIALSVTAMLVVVGQFSPSVVAGFGVGERVLSVMFLPAQGLAGALSTMVGQNLGARRPGRALRATRLATGAALVGLTAVGVVTVVAAEPLARVFTPDDAVVAVAVDFLRVTGLAFGVEGALRVAVAAFRGAGRTTLALAVTATTFLPVRLGAALLALGPLGPRAVWVAYALSGLVGFLGVVVVARRVDWAESVVD